MASMATYLSNTAIVFIIAIENENGKSEQTTHIFDSIKHDNNQTQ